MSPPAFLPNNISCCRLFSSKKGGCKSMTRQFPSLSNVRASIESCPELEKDVAPAKSAGLANGMQLGLSTTPEVLEPMLLEVRGRLPLYLSNGAYYRNGPGSFEIEHRDGEKHYPEHWFDALGLVHAFFFESETNTVTYRSRNIGENVQRTIEAASKDEYRAIKFSQQYRGAGWLGRVKHALGPLSKDPETGEVPLDANVSLQRLPGKGVLNARTDVNTILKLNPRTLQPEERFDFSAFNNMLTKPMSPAHGMTDRRTGEFFSFMTDYGPGKVTYTVYRIRPSGRGEIVAEFRDDPFYIHSFSLTENYVVLTLWPCRISLFRLLQTKSFVHGCNFDKSTPTKFVVISRKENKVVCSYMYEPFFCFHTINSFERENELVIDLSYYEDATIMNDFQLDDMRKGTYSMSRAVPMRFLLGDLSGAIQAGPDSVRQATAQKLADVRFEFGTVAPAVEHQGYRYVYGISDNDGKQLFGDITKLDTINGTVVRWACPGTFTGEPKFVPDPSGRREDDGSVLVLVLDSIEEKSALVVLDARTMKETARAVVPFALPHGFHGSFLAG